MAERLTCVHKFEKFFEFSRKKRSIFESQFGDTFIMNLMFFLRMWKESDSFYDDNSYFNMGIGHYLCTSCCMRFLCARIPTQSHEEGTFFLRKACNNKSLSTPNSNGDSASFSFRVFFPENAHVRSSLDERRVISFSANSDEKCGLWVLNGCLWDGSLSDVLLSVQFWWKNLLK